MKSENSYLNLQWNKSIVDSVSTDGKTGLGQKLVAHEGIEPATFALLARRSSQLS